MALFGPLVRGYVIIWQLKGEVSFQKYNLFKSNFQNYKQNVKHLTHFQSH